MDYLRRDEIPAYLDACSTRYRPLAELLLSAGIRIGEAVALGWARGLARLGNRGEPCSHALVGVKPARFRAGQSAALLGRVEQPRHALDERVRPQLPTADSPIYNGFVADRPKGAARAARPPLPDFTDPPIAEVALGVQFDPLPLRSVHFGILWQRFRDNFPNVQEQPPIESGLESFDSALPRPMFDLKVMNAPILPRVWFLDTENSELVQVQSDRFVRNWRRLPGQQYPRYERLRDSFAHDLTEFTDFVNNEGLGPLRYTQCEVNYVNAIPVSSPSPSGVLRAWRGHRISVGDGLQSTVEAERLAQQMRIVRRDKSIAGRLYVTSEPAQQAGESSPTLLMNLTYRGRVSGESVEECLPVLEEGRQVIVESFTSMTTNQMHKKWGRLA